MIKHLQNGLIIILQSMYLQLNAEKDHPKTLYSCVSFSRPSVRGPRPPQIRSSQYSSRMCPTQEQLPARRPLLAPRWTAQSLQAQPVIAAFTEVAAAAFSSLYTASTAFILAFGPLLLMQCRKIMSKLKASKAVETLIKCPTEIATYEAYHNQPRAARMPRSREVKLLTTSSLCQQH